MIQRFDALVLKKLYKPEKDSHKGQNGKLMVIGGSKLFHAASIWPLTVASRVVDMVYYSSVEENNRVVEHIKQEFRNGIVIPRGKIEEYINEADCVLIGPGLPRKEGEEEGDDDTKVLTENLLKKFPHKQWVIDGGSLQVIDASIIPENAIVTPHHQEFKILFGKELTADSVAEMAKKYNIVVLGKGAEDVVASSSTSVSVSGGNAGMTKGGTGDVLAGLVAALACKNDPFLAAAAGSYINKKAGDELYRRVGPYFNASDLADEIPKVMRELLF